jgi:hypothetical protein
MPSHSTRISRNFGAHRAYCQTCGWEHLARSQAEARDAADAHRSAPSARGGAPGTGTPYTAARTVQWTIDADRAAPSYEEGSLVVHEDDGTGMPLCGVNPKQDAHGARTWTDRDGVAHPLHPLRFGEAQVTCGSCRRIHQA